MRITTGLLLVEAYIGVGVVWEYSMRHGEGLSCCGIKGFAVARAQGRGDGAHDSY